MKWTSNLLFPEPEDNSYKPMYSDSLRKTITLSQNEIAVKYRALINRWWEDWNFDTAEIKGRLASDDEDKFESAIWELYLNSYFKFAGYHVRRAPDSDPNRSVDFVIRRLKSAYSVEATSISADSASTKNKIWNDVLDEIDKIQRKDLRVHLAIKNHSNRQPSAKNIANQIAKNLDSYSTSQTNVKEMPKFEVRDSDWVIQVGVLKAQTEKPAPIILSRALDNAGVLNDDEKLERKISRKKKRYSDLEHPFIIAVLRNSFFGADNNFAIFNFMFGSLQLRIQGDQTLTHFKGDGFWSSPERNMNVSGFIFLSRIMDLVCSVENPKLYVNPHLNDKNILNDFQMERWFGQDSEYKKIDSEESWDGMAYPPFRAKVTALASKMIGK